MIRTSETSPNPPISPKYPKDLHATLCQVVAALAVLERSEIGLVSHFTVHACFDLALTQVEQAADGCDALFAAKSGKHGQNIDDALESLSCRICLLRAGLEIISVCPLAEFNDNNQTIGRYAALLSSFARSLLNHYEGTLLQLGQ